MGYPVILNGDHAEFEREHATTPPHERPDWPLPSFDARDWAAAFVKTFPDCGVDEGTMLGWFSCALMRGYDEHAARSASADKMSQHTPGPWRWWTSNSWRRLTCENREHSNQDGGVLCPTVCRDGHPDTIVSDADMALIAAAPDLLEALRGVVAVADRDTVEFAQARAAIAKAELFQPISQKRD